ncbi:hypothetical protein JMG10_02650 [Nostoc ellipsosporum NOK]|nr:hypothetical protein [Nostoc ellipsosporum NOK]
MRYVKVVWVHDFEDEPVILYSEIDDRDFETRKIDIYSDGSFGIASDEIEFGGTLLSPEPIPSNTEISEDAQFLLTEIDEEEFNEKWEEYFSFLHR